jgi:uncharacterized membrane protein
METQTSWEPAHDATGNSGAAPPSTPVSSPPRPRALRGWWIIALIGSLFGGFASAVSTRDFVAHLDGQTHAITCSVLPTGGAELGASGCKTAMYSVYSSFFRTDLWGGLPVSLLALGVFAFFAAFALKSLLKQELGRRDGFFLWFASLLPVGMSVIYAVIAANELGAFCEVCIGIYIASGLLFLSGLGAWLRAPRPNGKRGGGAGFWAAHIGVGVAFVGLLVGIYMANVPADRPTMKGCGFLTDARDEAGVLLRLNPAAAAGAVPALAVLDPLCPACRSFDRRVHASGFDQKLDMQVLLFPLDATCNWMVKDSPHPGACAVSEAMLCTPTSAKRILDWAFENQQALLEQAKADEKAFRQALVAKFPETAKCVGTAAARAKVNKSMRFAVKNALAVQTPQLFVDGRRLCDEDSDLGLEYVLNAWLQPGANLPPAPPAAPPAEAPAGEP